MKLAVYIHIALLSRWEERVMAYLSLMEKSGLMNKLDRIHLSFVGEGDIDESIWSAYTHKITTHRSSSNLSDYEVPTQKLLYDFCCKHTDYQVLYIHTKNVGKPINPCVEDWVEYMSHFCITRWNDCVQQLKSFQTAGVDLREEPTLHYSGNFWWARASYIAMLPDPNEYKNIELYPNPLKSPRHNQEFWICFYKYPEFHKGIWESNINCYERHLHRYSANNYIHL
jgi:hypothetical protein